MLEEQYNPEKIESIISKKTAAIIPVHFGGMPCNLDEIHKIGKLFNLDIIEDAAHAIDSTYNGQACGTIGDVGIFSFDAVKNLTVGEGGGITTKDPDKIERAKIMRYCGIGKSGFDSAVEKANNKSKINQNKGGPGPNGQPRPAPAPGPNGPCPGPHPPLKT